MKMKSLVNIAAVSLFVIGTVYFLNGIYTNRSIFQERYSPAKYMEKFAHSQWIVENKNKVTISDADLYSHMAYQYTANNIDPTTQDFEVPPLGKYIIGWSLSIFHNQRVIYLFLAAACLLLIFYLTLINTLSVAAATLATALTMLNWLFLDQIVNSPQLDIFQLYFLLNVFLFFSLYEKKSKLRYLFLTGIAAGGFVSVKFFLGFYLIIQAWFCLYYFMKKKPLRQTITELLLINGLILGIYVVYYVQFFMQGGSFFRFLLVQKWIIGMYTIRSNIQTIRILGSYIPLLYANRWQFWSEGYPIIHYQNWSFTWPIIHLVGIFSLLGLYLKKQIQKNITLQLLTMFIIIYSLFLFVTPVWPRYFLLLFVPLNILIAAYLVL